MTPSLVERLAREWEGMTNETRGAIRAAFLEAAKVARESLHAPTGDTPCCCERCRIVNEIAARLEEIARD